MHHTVSPSTFEILDSALAGARDESIDGVEVLVRPALVASESEVLDCDGYLLGTPANIGYISGALKHFFDRIYYPCLEATRGRPFGAYVHGNLGADGATKAIETITTGLAWTPVAPVLELSGQPDKADREAVYELAATVAATLI